MSRFNKKKTEASLTINRQGGSAYTRSAEYRLVSLLLTNFVTNQFYRSSNQSLTELAELVEQVDPIFAAKAAVYARNEFGMRSISHALAANLAAKATGTNWGRRFYDRIVRRPDDMLEITAAYLNAAGAGNNLTNAMKKGFAAAFDRFDGYQLAKYRGEGKAVKLVDVVNLVRPIPTKRNAAALQRLVAGTLRNAQTWESKLSAAGQAKGATNKQVAKAEAWAELLTAKKLGYFALVRNLRNILEQAPECIDLVEAQLTDAGRIRKSLVLPFRLVSAYKEVRELKEPKQETAGSMGPFTALQDLFKGAKTDRPRRPKFSALRRRVLAALEKAINISCGNLPDLRNSLVAIDNSGSMGSPAAGSDKIKCNELGALFGIAL
ncbi:MAG: TROVE domain-containing protein, partial [Bacteroidota bacterium]